MVLKHSWIVVVILEKLLLFPHHKYTLIRQHDMKFLLWDGFSAQIWTYFPKLFSHSNSFVRFLSIRLFILSLFAGNRWLRYKVLEIRLLKTLYSAVCVHGRFSPCVCFFHVLSLSINCSISFWQRKFFASHEGSWTMYTYALCAHTQKKNNFFDYENNWITTFSKFNAIMGFHSNAVLFLFLFLPWTIHFSTPFQMFPFHAMYTFFCENRVRIALFLPADYSIVCFCYRVKASVSSISRLTYFWLVLMMIIWLLTFFVIICCCYVHFQFFSGLMLTKLLRSAQLFEYNDKNRRDIYFFGKMITNYSLRSTPINLPKSFILSLVIWWQRIQCHHYLVFPFNSFKAVFWTAPFRYNMPQQIYTWIHYNYNQLYVKLLVKR